MNLRPCSTYSLIVRDPKTGWLGSAVASKYLAVGGAVSHSQPGVGIVHAQFWCSHDAANRILAAIAAGTPPPAALNQAIAADPLPHKRQLLVMDMQGCAAVHTGADATPEHHLTMQTNLVAAGNTLASKDVVEAMVRSIQATGGQPLILRLILALEAAEALGGDHRGKQSAAVRVLQPMDRPWTDDEILDFRADDHPNPIAELRRLYELSPKGK
ncbi:MAG: DUF1028 domain-containing protein [Verrucomicrobiia bacterium]